MDSCLFFLMLMMMIYNEVEVVTGGLSFYVSSSTLYSILSLWGLFLTLLGG